MLMTLIKEFMPVIGAGEKQSVFERYPRGRVGSSRPSLRRKIVME